MIQITGANDICSGKRSCLLPENAERLVLLEAITCCSVKSNLATDSDDDNNEM